MAVDEAPLTSENDELPSELPPSSTFDGEDFLFHLYRGSELLQDNCVPEAKEELERALAMQPRDVEGQGLLGVVYFRLGLYPRAIQIYEELVRACPGEITPKVNLALCYLKTGLLVQSRDVLEEVIRVVPDHKRGWGYLGLVFERLGDHAKALASFERANQPQMVRRMQQLLEAAAEPPPDDHPGHDEVRLAAADAVDDLEGDARRFAAPGGDAPAAASRSGRWRAMEPGEERMPPSRQPRVPPLSLRPGSLPPPAPVEAPPPRAPDGPRDVQTPADIANAARLDVGISGVATYEPATVVVRVAQAFCARSTAIRALAPEREPFRHTRLLRHARGRNLDEPLGGAGAPFVQLEGTGLVVLGASDDRRALAMLLGDELVYVREDRLLGFDSTLRFENGRLPAADGDPVPIVQVGGVGTMVFEARRLRSLDIGSGQPVMVRASDAIGWIGRMLPQPVARQDSPGGAYGFVTFSGDGQLFLEG